ncbi:MAG TPA: response regulator [Stellaceae bacterium]|nr:response regulator [Stellaceae bacterium]
MPPIGLAALPGGLSMLGAPRTGMVLVAALLFAPALVGFAVALRGFDAVVARLRDQLGGECRQTIARVLLAALILAYVFGLLAALPGDPAIGPCLLIGSLNLAAAWLFLLNIVLEPQRSALRRYAALISDVTLLSILLAAGDGLTAALAVVYCYIAIANGEHHGVRALVVTIVLELAAFAAVVLATSFWWDRPLLAGGMLAAMALLPAYVGAVLHRLTAAKTAAEAANAAKNRFLAVLGDDLRGPLRAVARMGSTLDREALDPELRDMLARTRLNARAMLQQLDDMLNYVKIDDGSFAPETRSFDLHRLANGAISALRAPAAERGVTLALRIDPRLPYQLRGWPHQFRQILICLVTNAIRQVDKARLRVDFAAAALAEDKIVLRLTVASGFADRRLETAGEAEEFDDDSRHLGLAVAHRLAGLMGGRLAADSDPRRGLSLTVELPFAVDQASLALPLDLAELPVLIVTKDAEFVGELIEPLEAWRADPRWIGAGDAALQYLAGFDGGPRRGVMVVDGRGDVLQGLSWAHRATEEHASDPPYLLFIADEARIDSVIGLADGDLDGVLPAPFTHAALRAALHALRVEPADWFLTEPLTAPEPPPARRPFQEIAPLRAAASPQPMETPIGIDEPVPPPVAAPVPAAAHPPRPAPPPSAAEPVGFASPRTAPPRAPLAQAPFAQAPFAQAPVRRRQQILVATANPANRKILGSILARGGYIVHFAEDADDARQGLETRDIDALVIDLTGYAGADYGAARQCRKARATLPIIALTGDSPDIAERRGGAAGLDAVLPKPVEPRRLLGALATALDAPEPADAGPRGVVTELASHPRFAGEAAVAADRGMAPLGEEGEALQALIDNFRIDTARIVTDIDQAAGAGDVPAFEAAVQAMHASTEVFGVTRIRDILGSIREPTPAKLRLQGADFVHRLESELARLDGALVEYLKAAK